MPREKLKCLPGNYQCGGRCQSSKKKCRITANEAAEDFDAFFELVQDRVQFEIGKVRSERSGVVTEAKAKQWVIEQGGDGQKLLDRLDQHIAWWQGAKGIEPPTFEELEEEQSILANAKTKSPDKATYEAYRENVVQVVDDVNAWAEDRGILLSSGLVDHDMQHMLLQKALNFDSSELASPDFVAQAYSGNEKGEKHLAKYNELLEKNEAETLLGPSIYEEALVFSITNDSVDISDLDGLKDHMLRFFGVNMPPSIEQRFQSADNDMLKQLEKDLIALVEPNAQYEEGTLRKRVIDEFKARG